MGSRPLWDEERGGEVRGGVIFGAEWEGRGDPEVKPFGPKHTINSLTSFTLYCAGGSREEKMKDNWHDS